MSGVKTRQSFAAELNQSCTAHVRRPSESAGNCIVKRVSKVCSPSRLLAPRGAPAGGCAHRRAHWGLRGRSPEHL